MRLKYSVLCIDDEIDSLVETKKSLSAYNDTVGILTEYTDLPVTKRARETDSNKFKERIFKEIDQKLSNTIFDLILVDLHLGEDFEGGELIESIRNQTIYRPVIFFSGGLPVGEDKALEQLNASILKNGLVGKSVFVSRRGTILEADLRKICNEMHEEEHKLNATRGLLMDGTSQLDATILQHLQTDGTWSDLSEAQIKKAFKFISGKLAKNSRNSTSNSEILDSLAKGDFPSFVKWIVESEPGKVARTLDSQSRSEILRELLKSIPEQAANGKILSRYYNNGANEKAIANIRNEYAHQTAEQIGTAHNNERCKYIREELRAHFKNIKTVTKVP